MKKEYKFVLFWIALSYLFLYINHKTLLIISNRINMENMNTFSLLEYFVIPFIGIMTMGILIGVLALKLSSFSKMEYNTIVIFSAYLVLRYPLYLLFGTSINHIYLRWMLRDVVDMSMYFGSLIISMLIVHAIHENRKHSKKNIE